MTSPIASIEPPFRQFLGQPLPSRVKVPGVVGSKPAKLCDCIGSVSSVFRQSVVETGAWLADHVELRSVAGREEAVSDQLRKVRQR